MPYSEEALWLIIFVYSLKLNTFCLMQVISGVEYNVILPSNINPFFKCDISPSLYVLPEKSGPVFLAIIKVQWQLTESMMARPRC